MAITASGLYGLTREKQLIDTAGISIESETLVKALLVTDSESPNFDTHDFRNDITAEVTGTGYTAGGVIVTTTEVTVASPSAGGLKWDHDDVSWSSSTITSAMAMVDYLVVGSSATDMLFCLLDFVTAVSTSSGLLLVSIHANGVINEDYSP